MAGVPRPRLLVGGALAVLAVPVVLVVARVPLTQFGEALEVAWAFATPKGGPDRADVSRLAALLVWVVVAGAAVALLWLRASGRLAAGVFATLACALAAADLLRIGVGINPGIPVDHAEQPVTGAIARLQAARPARFAGLAPKFGLQPLVPDVAMRYGLYDARGYDYPIERRYDTLWRRAVAPNTGFLAPTMLVTPTERRAARARPVRGDGHHPAAGRAARARVGGHLRRCRRPAVRQPARAAAHVGGGRPADVAGDGAALDAILAPGFDPARTAVVERPVAGLADGPADAGGQSRIVRYEPDRVELAARAGRRSLVVLSDVHFPGWRATVDGRETPIERVDYLLRGVPVDAGTHRIVLEYRPASWRIGWIVSVLAALGLLAAVWKSERRWPGRSTAR